MFSHQCENRKIEAIKTLSKHLQIWALSNLTVNNLGKGVRIAGADGDERERNCCPQMGTRCVVIMIQGKAKLQSPLIVDHEPLFFCACLNTWSLSVVFFYNWYVLPLRRSTEKHFRQNCSLNFSRVQTLEYSSVRFNEHSPRKVSHWQELTAGWIS